MFETRDRVQVSPRVNQVCYQSDASDLWRSREELGQSIGSSRADVRACVRADVFSAEPAQQIAGLEVDAGCVVVDYRSTAVSVLVSAASVSRARAFT